MKRLIKMIMGWFTKESVLHAPTAGPVFRQIFRKVNDVTETQNTLDNF